ncbi:MAG: HAD family hydrolase [Jatrophihabitantaceae bacterium]
MSVLVATDLDRTMIYSRKALGHGERVERPVTVEVHDGADSSFMTAAAARAFGALADSTVLVPVTTRVPEQYLRVGLPGRPPQFAVAANGGVLYVDGVADRGWAKSVATMLAGTVPLSEVWAHTAQVCSPQWTKKVRNADGLFCYAILYPHLVPAGFVDDMTGWAAERGWRTSLQGRKLYWVPELLTKSAAVAEIARRIEPELLVAAGDSLLDVDLLLAADRAIHPRHGELFEQGWSSPKVTCTRASGAAAGEEILTWFGAQLPSAPT